MSLRFITGTRSAVKREILALCKGNAHPYLVDSMGAFDPYHLARMGIADARLTLQRLRVCRPFTVHQLRGVLAGLRNKPLPPDAVVIIAGIDCFDDALPKAHHEIAMRKVRADLAKIAQRANVVVGEAGASSHGLQPRKTKVQQDKPTQLTLEAI